MRLPRAISSRLWVPTLLESLEQRYMLATVAVDPEQTAQTIRAIGGNFAQGRHTGSALVNDAVGQYALENLSVARARIGIPLRAWEPQNDDGDPKTTGTFAETSDVRNVFLLMQDFQSRGIPITASVWNAPNWMVSNPTASDKRLVPAENYPELAESITRFLTTARDKYGVDVDAVSFNEADGGYNLKFTAQEHANFIKQAGPMMQAQGLSTLWLVGDTSSARGHVSYASAILQDAEARPYLGALSFHGWGTLSDAESVFTGISDLAQQYGKEVWCEEVGYDALLYKSPDTFKTWTYASRLAKVYYKILKLSQATVADYWQYQNDFPLVAATSLTPYPAFHVVQQLAQGFTPGTQVVAARSDDAAVLALAGRNQQRDTFMLQLINTATVSTQVTVTGLPADALTLIRSSATENGVTIGKYNPTAGSLTLTLPADSVSTLRNKLALPAPWRGRDVGTVGTQGDSHVDGGRFTLRGSGSGLGSTRDAAYLVEQPADGDARITARLLDTSASAEAGIMIRDGSADDAAHVALTRVGGELRLLYRSAAGAAASTFATIDASAGPYLRLLRQGNSFVASASSDGASWTSIGSVDVPMGLTTSLALVTTSNDNAALASASFDAVGAAALQPLPAPTRLTAVAANNSQVDLSWTDNSGSESTFELQRSSDGVNFSTIVTLMSNTTRYSNTGLSSAAAYWYRIRSRNVAGLSANSAVAMIRTPGHHEAENAALLGAVVSSTNSGYSGSGYVSFTQANGGYIEWTVTAPYSGNYILQPRYSQTVSDDMALQISIDGQVVAPAMSFPRLGSPTTWLTLPINVTLSAGTHRVRATTIGLAGLNMDRLRLRPMVPATPAGVSAEPSSGGIRLSWTADGSVDDEIVRIERSADGISFTQVGTTAANASTYLDAAVEPRTSYVYQIRASNAAGDSAYGAKVQATAPEPEPAPAAPTDLAAVAVSSSRIDLSWTDVAENEQAYIVAISRDGVTFDDVATLAANTSAYSATDLSAGTRHYFRVRASNAGAASAAAAADAVTFVIAPETFTADAAAADAIALSWSDVVGEFGYLVERAPSSSGTSWTTVTTTSADVTSYRDAGLPDGTGFDYRVTSLGSSGDRATTSTRSAVTQLPPPQNLAAVAATSRRVDLSWTDAAANESGYIVERAPSGGSFTEVGRTGANVQSYADTTAAPSTAYSYRVRGFNGAGAEGLAATASATTPADPSTTVTVGTSTAAHVRNGTYAGTSYGTSREMQVKLSATAGETRETYVRFDIGSLADVSSAKLRLYGKLSDATSMPIAVYGSGNTTWTEAGLTWNAKPAVNTAALASATVKGKSNAWYEWDVSSYVREQRAAGATAVTLVLKGTTATGALATFRSDESGTTSERPRLVVTQAAAAAALVVSKTQLTVPEGGTGTFTVQLSAAPSADVTVSVTRQSGDSDLSAAPATLLFTPTNWSTPQTVTVAAAQDTDSLNGQAVFAVTASGMTSQTVTATEADDDLSPPLVSTVVNSVATYVRGGTYATQNFGSATEVAVKTSATNVSDTREGYLKFDVSSFAPGSVTGATLRLFGKLSSGTGVNVGAFAVADSGWSEDSMTWDTKPASGSSAIASRTVSNTSGAWYEWDITSLVRDARAAGQQFVSIALKATNTTDGRAIFNSDDASSNKPELTVTTGP